MRHRVRSASRLAAFALTLAAVLLGLVGTSMASPTATPSSLSTVPNVVGMISLQATDLLVAAGYAVEEVAKPVTRGDCSRDGTVSAQSPRGGTHLAPGGTVTITVLTFFFCA